MCTDWASSPHGPASGQRSRFGAQPFGARRPVDDSGPAPAPWAASVGLRARRRRPFPGFGMDFAPMVNDRATGRPTAILPAVWRKSPARIVQRPRLVDMAKLAEARRKSRTAAMICGDVCRCADAHGVAPRGAKVFGGLRRPAEASQTATEPRRTSWT